MKNIIFMGTPDFSVPILKALYEQEEVHIQCVITQPDRKVGRRRIMTPPPVKQCAQSLHLPVMQPEKLNTPEVLDTLNAFKPDLVITAAFGQFLPKALLELPTYGAINVHASLLPKYRGAAPIHYALLNGDDQTGITLMYMTPKMDAGDIIAQREIPITDEHDTGQLFKELSVLGRDLLIDTLPDVFNGNVTPMPQDVSGVTYAPMITSEQEEIDWTMSARDIFNKVRAFRPFPSTHTFFNGERFKLWDVESLHQTTTRQPGEIAHVTSEALHVAAGDGRLVALLEVQPAGKSRLSIQQYLKGSSVEVGMTFEQHIR